MPRRAFLQRLGLLFLPLVRTLPARPAQAVDELTYRDSVGSAGVLLRAVLTDRDPQTGVGYAAD